MLSTKSENDVTYEIHMDIEKVREEILKCDNVNLVLSPLPYPDPYFCPYSELLDISSFISALNSTTNLYYI